MKQIKSLTHSLVFTAAVVALGACGTSVLDENPGGEEADVSGDSAELERAVVEEPAGDLAAFEEAAATCSIVVRQARELMITNVAVVEDPVRTTWTEDPADNPKAAAWTFGKLMTDMAGSNDPSAFVRSWLAQWETAQSVNGFTVPARTAIRTLVIDPWLAASGGTTLDLKKAPFRLLAIVNRMDLRKLTQGNAGEGRFVFGVLNATGGPTQFVVIFEYKLPATTVAQVRGWASDWHALSDLTPGTAEYNDQLQAITDRFAGKNAAPTRVNGSALSQLRTNEVALAFPWELREFRLNAAAGGLLKQGTVAQTPASSRNGRKIVADYINGHTNAILEGRNVVPLTFNDVSFRGGSSLNNIDFWDSSAAINTPKARHLFSLNTCNGCHGRETRTQFLQINPRSQGVASTLSGFLTGIDVTDPTDSRVSRHFDDLARRQQDLKNILCAAEGLLAPSNLEVGRVE